MHYPVTTSLHLNQPHINHIQHFDREKQTNKSIKTKTPKIDKKVRGGLLNHPNAPQYSLGFQCLSYQVSQLHIFILLARHIFEIWSRDGRVIKQAWLTKIT